MYFYELFIVFFIFGTLFITFCHFGVSETAPEGPRSGPGDPPGTPKMEIMGTGPHNGNFEFFFDFYD